jgi:hypothetical protein
VSPRAFIVRHWRRLGRWQKRLAVVAKIIASIGAICSAVAVSIIFLADPPDYVRLKLDHYLPGLVDLMQGSVCRFKAGKHSISTGPLASCDSGSLDRLVEDSCVSYAFVVEDRPDDADDPATKIKRVSAKERMAATRVCRTWPRGTNTPVSATADTMLEALANDMPECFGKEKP